MWKARQRKEISVASSILGVVLAFSPLVALAERPKPPATGTPSGNTTSGATRPEIYCPATEKPLTAIFANQGKDFTSQAYPTLLFYVPYSRSQISQIEFILTDRERNKTLDRFAIELQDKPGIIRVQLRREKAGLEIGGIYHWRFNLDCEPDETIAPDLVLEGWIRRVAYDSMLSSGSDGESFETYFAYKQQDVWYDAIATLAKLRFNTSNSNSQGVAINETWNDTLKSLKLDWIIDESLVDSVQQAIEC